MLTDVLLALILCITFIISKQAAAVGVDLFNTKIDDIWKNKANFNLKCRTSEVLEYEAPP